MKNHTLTIAEPCHEDWNSFEGKGDKRFCQSCSKHVQDFTKMSTKEIIDFLAPREGQSICGVFQKTHITELTFREKVIFEVKKNKKNPFKLSRAVMILCVGVLMNFLSSCTKTTTTSHHNVEEVELMGDVEYVELESNDTTSKHTSIPKCHEQSTSDTIAPKDNYREHMKGKIQYIPPKK